MYGFIMAYALSVTLKSKDLATHGFQDTPTQCTEAEPSFRKVSLPPAKLCMPFPTHHLGYRVLATNLLPLMNRLTYPGVGILSLNSIG